MRDDTAFETCQVVFWRGYLKCAFYAVTSDAEPVGSPFFRSRDRSPIQSGAALEAHRALVERLQGEGWEAVARGRAWYALTFRRRGWSPVEEDPATELPAVEAHAAPQQPPLEPEPAPATEPPSGAPARLRSRRQIGLLLAAAVSIALAVVLGLTLYGANSAQGQNGTATRPANLHQAHRARDRNPAATAAPAPRRLAPTEIVVTGARGSSWVEARVGSETGRLLFEGVVADGRTVRVTAPVVWITFGAAGNLDLRVNGRTPVPGSFRGTITAVIAHGRVRRA
jgi:hypothetical protein